MYSTANAAPSGNAVEASKAAMPAQQARSAAAATMQDMGNNTSGLTKAKSSTDHYARARQSSQAAGRGHSIPEPKKGFRPSSSTVVRHVPGGQQGERASPRQQGRGATGQLRGRRRGRGPQLPQKRRAPDNWQHGRAEPITGHHERPKHKRALKQTAVPRPMSMGRVSPGRLSRGRGHRARKGSSGR